jgi:hypothetical protein
MDRDRLLGYLHRGKVIVAERVASAPERLAWIGIYPLNPARETTRELLARAHVPIRTGHDVRYYHVRAFELDRSLHDKSFGEPDLRKKEDRVVVGDDGLVARLEELGVDIDTLEVPWKTEYPL